MDSIQREILVCYHKPSLQDIITMIPVMDGLAKDLKTYTRWTEEETEESTKNRHYDEAIKLYNQLSILQNLGFSTSDNNMDIQNPDRYLQFK